MANYTLLLKTPVRPRVSGIVTDPLADSKASRPVKNITNDAIGWERTERLVGGWWDAGFTVAGDEGDLIDRLNSWLGYTVEEIAGLTTWRGLIWKMALSSNGVTRELSMDKVYNAVSAKFTEHLTNGGFEVDGSSTTFNGWDETGTVAAETTAANVGRGSQSAKLTGKANVRQDVTVQSGRSYRLNLSTRGEDFATIDNGDFETAGAGGADVFSGWSEAAGNGTITDETTQVAKGSHACKLTNGAIVYQSVTVKPKYEYEFRVYTRTKDKIAVTNGNLEDGSGTTFTGWTNVSGAGSVGSEATIVSKGARAVKLINNAYIHQSITVSPKNEYELSVYTCGDGTNDGGIGIYDVTNAAYIINNKPTGVTENKYRRIEHKFTAPPSCTSIRIELHGTGVALSPAYFDVVKMEQITNEQCGRVVLYDATNAVYIVNGEPTGVTSDRYSRYQRSFVTPPSCTSLTISLIAPEEGEVYFDQAELEYVTGSNALRVTVYDNDNTANIVRLWRTNHEGPKYNRYELDFTVPDGCTSIKITLHGYVDCSVWIDEVSLRIIEDDKPGDAYTDWTTNSKSIARYGRKEYIVDATAHPQATAEIMRDGVLALCAWPKIEETAYDVKDVKAPLLTVYCLGFVPAGNKRSASAVDEGDASDVIATLIAQSDYLTAGIIDVATKTARLNKDKRGKLITEIARMSVDATDVASLYADKDNRLHIIRQSLIPIYYLRGGVITENKSGTQPASVRLIRPGFLIDLDWKSTNNTSDRTGVVDNSRTGIMATVTVAEDDTITIKPATQDDLETYLDKFDT